MRIRLESWIAVAAAAATACAHAPARREPHGKLLQDDGLGVSLELPAGVGFKPGSGLDGVLARADDGTLLRAFPEHFAAPPTVEACWKRLMLRLPSDLRERPADAASLAARAPSGLVRAAAARRADADGAATATAPAAAPTGPQSAPAVAAPAERRLFFAPYLREDSCLVLVVEGPADSPLLAKAAPLALRTFRVLEPSPQARVRLAFDAGTELLDLGEHRAALARFERVLEAQPDAPRARLGAGLAAFFAGDATAAKAVEHLERVRAQQAQPGVRKHDAQAERDLLMYLGLAYASLKDYGRAMERLGELANRHPDYAVGLYNFACVLALGGDGDEALYQLRAALARDPKLATQAREDRDLVSLHGRPEWGPLLGGAGGAPTQDAAVAAPAVPAGR